MFIYKFIILKPTSLIDCTSVSESIIQCIDKYIWIHQELVILPQKNKTQGNEHIVYGIFCIRDILYMSSGRNTTRHVINSWVYSI